MKKLIACLLMILMSVPALAAIIVSDPFEDGGRTDGADAQDAAWWKAYGSSTNMTLDVAVDSVLGNALHFTNTSTTTGRRGVANFTSTTLQNVGDVITLSLDFRLVSSPAKANAIRFGLFDAGTTLLTADNSDTTATNAIVGTDKGYYAALGAGVAESTIYEDKGTSSLMGGTDINTYTKDYTLNITDLLKHSASLILTMTDTGVSINVVVDSVSVLTYADTTPVLTTFSEIAVGGGNNLDIYFDNVNVDFTPIPEPATLSILALGALAVLRRKRRA